MAEPIALDNVTSVNRAVEKAREALALAASHPARTWPVARIKPGAPGYLLVVFGTPQAAVGIATIDLSSGEILEKAGILGGQPHFLISAEEAIQRAGLAPCTEAILVWEPTQVSHSPFYPFWQLLGPGRTVWIDSVRGTIWKRLDAARGGGTQAEHDW